MRLHRSFKRNLEHSGLEEEEVQLELELSASVVDLKCTLAKSQRHAFYMETSITLQNCW